MTDRPSNEERRARIAGERVDSSSLTKRLELPLLADLLADRSTLIRGSNAQS